MKRELKGIEIFNVILIAIIVICSMTIFRINIMRENATTNIPTAEIKVSKKYDQVNSTDRNTQSEYVTFDAFPLPLFTVIDLFTFYYYNVLICEI